MRTHQPHRKAIRPKKLQQVDPEIEKLCKSWMKSPERKRFEKRYKRRA